jgi:hypothetical protein
MLVESFTRVWWLRMREPRIQAGGGMQKTRRDPAPSRCVRGSILEGGRRPCRDASAGTCLEARAFPASPPPFPCDWIRPPRFSPATLLFPSPVPLPHPSLKSHLQLMVATLPPPPFITGKEAPSLPSLFITGKKALGTVTTPSPPPLFITGKAASGDWFKW